MNSINIYQTGELPGQFPEFIGEVARGIGDLYGAHAAQEYLRTAAANFQGALQHPNVIALTAVEADDLAGMLVAVLRDGVGHISFLHVGHAFENRGVEGLLLQEGIQRLRNQDAEGILLEVVPFGPYDVDDTLAWMDFQRVERMLMAMPIAGPPASLSMTRTLTANDYEQAAHVLVAAYANHPGRKLHSEVRGLPEARAFITGVAEGRFGATRPEYLRSIGDGESMRGVFLGARAAPETGFVLHVAVHPTVQGEGYGARLLREGFASFQHDGLTRVVLGVTKTNPAVRLYERLGFRHLRDISAYTWWRA